MGRSVSGRRLGLRSTPGRPKDELAVHRDVESAGLIDLLAKVSGDVDFDA